MRWRRVLLFSGIAVLAIGMGAAGWGLLIYNEATKIDRSNPKVVTDEYLRALLVRKDKIGADLYACSDQNRLAPIKTLREELDQRERDFGVTILVAWGAYQSDDTALRTNLTITAYKGDVEESSNNERWRFYLIEDNGWRVCGAERIGSSA